MIQRRRTAGFTLIEFAASSFVGLLVVFAAARLLLGAGDLTDSINHSTRSEERADRALWTAVGMLRSASLSSAEHADGSSFDDGEQARAVSVVVVDRFEEGVAVGDRMTLRWDLPAAGTTDGTLVLEGAGVSRTLARGVTDFLVRREGDGFALELRTDSGPDDSRRRGVRRGVTVTPRTP